MPLSDSRSMNFKNKTYEHLLQDSLAYLSVQVSTNEEFAKLTSIIDHIRQTLFFDLKIICSEVIYPGHKYILSIRSEILRNQLVSGVSELDWTEYGDVVVYSLLSWFYTDKICVRSDTLALDLLQASSNLQLHALFDIIEKMLLMSVSESSAPKFYLVAVKVGATALIEKCSRISSINFNNSPPNLLDYCYETNEKMSPSSKKTIMAYQQLFYEGHNILKIWLGFRKFLLLASVKIYFNISEYIPAHAYILNIRGKGLGENIDATSAGIRTAPDCILALLRWFYTDTIDLEDHKTRVAVLSAAHKLDLTTLVERCQEVMIKKVRLDSLMETYQNALDNNCTKLREHCEYVINSYWKGLPMQAINIQNLANFILNEPQRLIIECQTSECQTSECPITQLNNDCWQEIFTYISLADLSSIKSTCSRFSMLADRCFRTGNKRLEIQLSSVLEGIWILQHFGEFTHSLSIEGTGCWSLDTTLSMVVKFCTDSLHEISINCTTFENVSNETIVRMKEILKNLEIIRLTHFRPEAKTEMLNYCENLREIHLINDEPTVQTNRFTKRWNIKRMTLVWIQVDEMFEELCRQFIHLENLRIHVLPITGNEIINMKYLAELDYLKELKINVNTNSLAPLLEILAEKNILENLCLFCGEMDESVAIALGKFTSLKELRLYHNMIMSDNFPDTLSRNMASIEKIVFFNCTTVSVENITSIIENHLILKELLIVHCCNFKFIDKDNYKRLLKQRNLIIFLDNLEYKTTIDKILDDLSDFVRISRMPNNRKHWHP